MKRLEPQKSCKKVDQGQTYPCFKMESKTFFFFKKHKTMYGKLKMFDNGWRTKSNKLIKDKLILALKWNLKQSGKKLKQCCIVNGIWNIEIKKDNGWNRGGQRWKTHNSWKTMMIEMKVGKVEKSR